jgi:hypothetical protein
MPFGADGRITLASAVHWLRERAAQERPKIGASEANDRRAAAEAHLAELRLARELALVVPADEARQCAEEEIGRVRAIVAQIPSTHAPLIAKRLNCSHREAAAVLRELAELVATDLAAPDDDPAEEDVAA